MDARQITKASKSNLALAFIALPRRQREQITLFYSFCRVVDDLADEPGMEPGLRRRALETWRAAVCGPVAGESPLAVQVRDLMAELRLPTEHFIEIIRGCEMDLDGTHYETWADLQMYCHRVASVVGLVSVRIFGCRPGEADDYACKLGLALQLTNILRDVGHDYANGGRVYLPGEEIRRFNCDPARFVPGGETDALRELMEFEAARARQLFSSAIAARPQAGRRSLVAAEIMRMVYSRLLVKMRRDGFRVLTRRYRLTRWEKVWCVGRGWLGMG
jgi:phytoene synthase